MFVDSTVARMDNLVRDIANMVEDVEDLKTSLQFSQADLDDLKTSKVKCTEEVKAISGSLSGYQTSIKDLSSQLDYLENQDAKTESWSDIKTKAKKNSLLTTSKFTVNSLKLRELIT